MGTVVIHIGADRENTVCIYIGERRLLRRRDLREELGLHAFVYDSFYGGATEYFARLYICARTFLRRLR